jgi:hypothetical protein
MEFGLARVTLSLQPQIETVKRSSWFLVLVFFAMSCLEEPDCYLLNNEFIGISFRVAGSSTADSVRIQSIAHNNTIFLQSTAADTAVTSLIIAADRIVDAFRLNFQNAGTTKSIDLKYKVQAQFVSEECGTRYVMSDLQAPLSDFDSVLVTNPTPGRDGNASNIVIYRCPQAETLEIKLWQYTLPATGASTTRIASAQFNSIDYSGTMLYQNQRVATLRLPVNKTEKTATYHFSLADDLGNDTKAGALRIRYRATTNKPYLACGDITTIDSIRVEQGFEVTEFQDNTNGTNRDRLTDPIVTNLNVYRCPPTNFIQLAFVREGTTTAADASLISITDNFSGRTFYEGATARSVVLALNKDATTTTFNLNFADRTEVVTFNYSFQAPRADLFAENSPCRSRNVITNLQVAPNDNVVLQSASVLYPATVNANVEIPN